KCSRNRVDRFVRHRLVSRFNRQVERQSEQSVTFRALAAGIGQLAEQLASKLSLGGRRAGGRNVGLIDFPNLTLRACLVGERGQGGTLNRILARRPSRQATQQRGRN